MNKSDVRDYILKSLYENKYMFLARDKDGILNAYKDKPRKLSIGWIGDEVTWYRVFEVKGENIFDCVKWEDEEPLDIAEELGVVNWEKVPVDAKVYVKDIDSDEWLPRHFAGFDSKFDQPFITFDCGKSSWTNDNFPLVRWDYCKLVEE